MAQIYFVVAQGLRHLYDATSQQLEVDKAATGRVDNSPRPRQGSKHEPWSTLRIHSLVALQ